jgi:hypothetical protein
MSVVSSVLPKRSRLIFDAVEDSVEGMSMYDDVDEVVAAVQCRLSRRQLPKITEDGFVEYGLLIPHAQVSKVRDLTTNLLRTP